MKGWGRRRRSGGPLPLHALIAAIFVSGVGTLIALCAADGPEGGPASYAACLVAEYEGVFGFRMNGDGFALVAQGLNGGNSRQTQVYSDGESEIAFSYRALTATENQLAESAGVRLERWAPDPSLGQAALTLYLRDDKSGGYYLFFAESCDMTAEELAGTVGGAVAIDTAWGRTYTPPCEGEAG